MGHVRISHDKIIITDDRLCAFIGPGINGHELPYGICVPYLDRGTGSKLELQILGRAAEDSTLIDAAVSADAGKAGYQAVRAYDRILSYFYIILDDRERAYFDS